MKVMLVNGSPHRQGTTARALEEVATTLAEEGIDSEVFWIGAKPVGGCMGCMGCARKGECVIDDVVNEFRPKAKEADGFVFGAPVHYAHAGASLLGFMDRLFYSDSRAGNPDNLSHKPAAAVVVARRAGVLAAFDDINRFFTIKQMPIVSSRYWNNVFGLGAADANKDEEGLRTMRTLARNMAWMLRCIEVGRAQGIEPPELEDGPATNFIR